MGNRAMTRSEAARKLLKHGSPPPLENDPTKQPFVRIDGPTVSGHYMATVYWHNPEVKDLIEPWDTGHGRYPGREAAVVEGRKLAAALDIVMRL